MRVARLVPPYAVWLVATAAYCGVAAAKGYGPQHPDTWARNDSYLYLDIVRHGYFLAHCLPPSDPQLFCGDTGWFPGYPWLVKGLSWFGLPATQTTAVAVAWLFCLGSVVLVWRFLDRKLEAGVLLGLLFAAFAPGRIYDYALFPLSMLACFTLLHLRALARGRLALACATAFVATLSYPLGAVLAVTSAIWLLAFEAGPLRDRVRATALIAGSVGAAIAVVVVVMRIQSGLWNAYPIVERQYHVHLREPFAPVIQSVRDLVHAPLATHNAPALQTLLVTVAVAAVTIAVARRRTRSDLLVLIWVLGTWLAANALTGVSLYRSQAALLPLVLLLPRLPRSFVAVLVIVAAWLTVPMTELFLSYGLI